MIAKKEGGGYPPPHCGGDTCGGREHKGGRDRRTEAGVVCSPQTLYHEHVV